MKKYYFIKPDPTYQDNLMEFGWECGEGWFPIIEEALNKIEEIIEKMPKKEQKVFKKSFEILQIKQKLGGLRIYVNMRTDEIVETIVEAEEKAEQTCEVCGKPGKLREVNRWLFTSCDEHYNKKLEEI
jgi:predicted transport protein